MPKTGPLVMIDEICDILAVWKQQRYGRILQTYRADCKVSVECEQWEWIDVMGC